MARASRATLVINATGVRFLPGALDYARRGAIPGGLKNNREFASCDVERVAEISEEVEALLYDPQTSGGLLIALGEGEVASLARDFSEAYVIGRVVEWTGKAIRLE
jgi:selenide,water dikinase